MKRKGLFVFVLFFWMLILCTFLSSHIEQWMMPFVSTTTTPTTGVLKEISADSLFYDEQGMHIYRAWLGQNWDAGLRVWEVDSSDYTVIDGKVRFNQSNGEFIQYASRTLRAGEEVRKLESVFLKEDDNWVAVFPDGIPEYELLNDKMSVETEIDTAMIICAPEAAAPFMEDRARSAVIVEKTDEEWYMPHTSSFYSLGDLRQFMNNLLLLGVLVAMMLFTVILWAWSFWISRDYVKNKKQLIVNGSVCVGLLALSPLPLHFINLPASMLPQYHITDFPHYGRLFGELFGELNRLTDAGSEIAAAAIKHAETCADLFFVILALGVLLGIITIGLEVFLGRNQKCGKHKEN